MVPLRGQPPMAFLEQALGLLLLLQMPLQVGAKVATVEHREIMAEMDQLQEEEGEGPATEIAQEEVVLMAKSKLVLHAQTML